MARPQYQRFLSYLRDDPKFYFPETREEKKITACWLPASSIPCGSTSTNCSLPNQKATIVVKPVEPFREQSAGGAFYEDPSEDGKRLAPTTSTCTT